MNFLKQLWNNKQFIVGVILVLFFVLFLNQCSQTKKAKDKLKQTELIAQQNIAALGDSSIQLRLTKEQLELVDKNLYTALLKVDSLLKVPPKEIWVTKPVYLGKDVVVPSTLIYDSIKKAYGLSFKSPDMVRTIEGTSYFKLFNEKEKLTIIPDSTIINNFKLNFAIVITQYDDVATKYTRTSMIPFFVKEDGTLGQEIPASLLLLKFRNAEILDKPFSPNNPTSNPDGKRHLQTGWAFTISPLAMGFYLKNGLVGYGWTPNIGISYYITLRK